MFISARYCALFWIFFSIHYLFLYFKIIYFLQARIAVNSIKRMDTSGWFVRMENDNCEPN